MGLEGSRQGQRQAERQLRLATLCQECTGWQIWTLGWPLCQEEDRFQAWQEFEAQEVVEACLTEES